MRTLSGTRTLDLWSTFLRMTGMEPLAQVGGGGAVLASDPARRRRQAHSQPQSRPAAEPTRPWSDPSSEPSSDAQPTAAGEAHRELRMRLVEEYARRLDVVRAALAPLRDAWSVEAVDRADRLAHGLAAWERHLRSVPGTAPEPQPDLQTLGGGVLDLVGRAHTHLSWTDRAPADAARSPSSEGYGG